MQQNDIFNIDLSILVNICVSLVDRHVPAACQMPLQNHNVLQVNNSVCVDIAGQSTVVNLNRKGRCCASICYRHRNSAAHCINRRESNYLATYTVQYALLQNRETAELVCADIRRRMYTFSYGTVEKMIADVTAFLKEHPDNEAAAAWNALVTDLQDEMTRIDTVTVEVSLDEQLLADVMAYVQARGLTFQQLAETSIETLIREHGSLLSYKSAAPASPTDEPEQKEES